MGVVINQEPAALPAADLSLFHATDELLSHSPVLIFYGPTSTSAQTTNSRIQTHVFTPAGLASYARLIISPTASFYNAVTCLPREEQGDEICRGLAFSLYKYFVELPAELKSAWERRYSTRANMHMAPALFTEQHAAIVAAKMVKVENVEDVIVDVRHALGEQTLSWVDLDVVLPLGSIHKVDLRESAQFEEPDDDALEQQYGSYAPVIRLFGESTFLPTSRLRRAPSKASQLSRSQSFSRKQKESLRREMCELLDTEENYVNKVHDLVNNVAVEFREKAKHRSASSSSPNEQTLQGLFPPSLDQILEVNSTFLEELRVILEETENGAIQDIEESTDDVFIAPLRGQKDPLDVTGAARVAKALVEWFPKFGDCYTDYMAAHGDFSQLLKAFTKEPASSFSKRVYETGEQRLTSLLIEPVQRLPRYNLYIDQIVKQLPVRHPAIKTFLKARDIISEICSREGSTAQQMKITDRLRKTVYQWPSSFRPQGRLISAIDAVELAPPYHGELSGPATTPGILVLFSDFLVILHKPNGSTATARSLLADLDSPRLNEASDEIELIFHQHLRLCDVFASEHAESSIVQLLSPTPRTMQLGRPLTPDRQNIGIRMYYVQGAYEGRAQRVVEDIVKARVEGRFAEAERESYKWEVRSRPGDLNLFSAVTEESGDALPEGRREPAKIQVLIEPAKFSQPIEAGYDGIEVVVKITILDNGFYLMDVTGPKGYLAKDKLTKAEFLPVLTKRLTNYFQQRNNVKNPVLSEAYLFRNQLILQSLRLQMTDVEEWREMKSRPASPVKMLSNIFGASVGRDGGGRRLQRNAHTLGDIPRMAPPLQLVPTRTQSRDGPSSRPTSSRSGFDELQQVDSLTKLEDSLANITMALSARKGNIVGRSVRARAVADELVVNELYNSLLESPSNLDLASQSSIDVLFAVFDKFLNFAWKERMGPVLSHATFVSLQMRSDSMYPMEFEEYFRATFNNLASHNQRATRVIIQLLAELLDGTSNDGDRGILTAAFAEMMVPAGNANDFISLIDRLVQDIDALFPVDTPGCATPSFGSMDGKGRHNAGGSINSNTSLRRRFGFGNLSRENSKSENESKVSLLWRSLSKNSHSQENFSASVSKAGSQSVGRSNSIDNGRHSPKRPSSRDRPTVLGAFQHDSSGSQTNRSFLGTIGEIPPSRLAVPVQPRKKRRSSLSDLKELQFVDDAPAWSSQTPRRPDSTLPRNRETQKTRESVSPPRTPLRTPVSSHKHTSSIPAPMRLGSPIRKENEPVPPSASRRGSVQPESRPLQAFTRRGSVQPPAPATPRRESKDEVTIKSLSQSTSTHSRRRNESITSIPTLRPMTGSIAGLSERPGAGNSVRLPPSTPRSPIKAVAPSTVVNGSGTGAASTGTPRRLRMQSPQKLRERLQTQQKDIESASQDLQSVLNDIGHELNAKSTPRLHPQTSAPALGSGTPTKGQSMTLEARIAALEKQARATLDALSTRASSISQDLTTSLQVSEARVKQLDQLYRDSNAENEALYARFNEELEKVASSVRRGKVGEEVDRRLRASEEEAARLRKENARLKREVAGLKAQIRE
ncbi:RhoGEF domain-containing protein [Stagonosporopsis vannaccii]|nr:RhoGEF domain-containing protein [Stagonosporopsis vannaccii]